MHAVLTGARPGLTPAQLSAQLGSRLAALRPKVYHASLGLLGPRAAQEEGGEDAPTVPQLTERQAAALVSVLETELASITSPVELHEVGAGHERVLSSVPAWRPTLAAAAAGPPRPRPTRWPACRSCQQKQNRLPRRRWMCLRATRRWAAPRWSCCQRCWPCWPPRAARSTCPPTTATRPSAACLVRGAAGPGHRGQLWDSRSRTPNTPLSRPAPPPADVCQGIIGRVCRHSWPTPSIGKVLGFLRAFPL